VLLIFLKFAFHDLNIVSAHYQPRTEIGRQNTEEGSSTLRPQPSVIIPHSSLITAFLHFAASGCRFAGLIPFMIRYRRLQRIGEVDWFWCLVSQFLTAHCSRLTVHCEAVAASIAVL